MTYYNVGKIVNTQGLQGELRVLSVTDFADERFKKKSILALFDDKDNYIMDVEVASHRKHKNFDIVKFKGLYHINDVEKYEGNTLIGQVKEILQPGANDVWVVKRKGKKDLLLPYIPPVVLDVDVAAGRIEVELMEGLDDED